MYMLKNNDISNSQYIHAIHPYKPSTVVDTREFKETLDLYKEHYKAEKYDELYKTFVNTMKEVNKMKKELKTEEVFQFKSDVQKEIDKLNSNTSYLLSRTPNQDYINTELIHTIQELNTSYRDTIFDITNIIRHKIYPSIKDLYTSVHNFTEQINKDNITTFTNITNDINDQFNTLKNDTDNKMLVIGDRTNNELNKVKDSNTKNIKSRYTKIYKMFEDKFNKIGKDVNDLTLKTLEEAKNNINTTINETINNNDIIKELCLRMTAIEDAHVNIQRTFCDTHIPFKKK